MARPPRMGKGSRKGRDRPEEKGDVNSLGTSSPAFLGRTRWWVALSHLGQKVLWAATCPGTEQSKRCNNSSYELTTTTTYGVITAEQSLSLSLSRARPLGASSILFCDVFGALLWSYVCFGCPPFVSLVSRWRRQENPRKPKKKQQNGTNAKKLAFVSKRIGC